MNYCRLLYFKKNLICIYIDNVKKFTLASNQVTLLCHSLRLVAKISLEISI